MRKKAKRDLTIEQQLARGPLDLPYLALVLLLTAIGLIMLLSASYASAYYNLEASVDTGGNPYYYFMGQLKFAVAGIVIMYGVSKFDYQRWRLLSVPALLGSIFLLILIFTPLGRSSNGARRWLNLGFSFQPSELVKVAVILFFAARLSKRKDQIKAPPKKWNRRTRLGRMGEFAENIGLLELIPYGTILVIILFLLYLQPHMSGMILVCSGAAAVLFASGIRLYWFVGGGALVATALAFVITQTDYMNARIQLWLDPLSDLQNGGYQLWQSQIAIGSGGLLGLGLGNSRQKYMFLPEEHNDFVFAIVCEELGLIGACLIIALFALLIIRGYWLALHARDRFGSLLIVGINTQLAAQIICNIGVVTGAIPTTGISLPFFSYGGTALVVQLAEVGLILAVSRQIVAPKVE
ncbi:FtsW/RodA/SpoVE family cell cycle protein [Pseudoflavonifractor capillosus]|uniref:FtsW/RodA/SpoVE family cell cycle protein n=1 Tax=Pseudoflavonifractor capillosus TaxID=106588 RepID=UPI0031F83EE1